MGAWRLLAAFSASCPSKDLVLRTGAISKSFDGGRSISAGLLDIEGLRNYDDNDRVRYSRTQREHHVEPCLPTQVSGSCIFHAAFDLRVGALVLQQTAAALQEGASSQPHFRLNSHLMEISQKVRRRPAFSMPHVHHAWTFAPWSGWRGS